MTPKTLSLLLFATGIGLLIIALPERFPLRFGPVFYLGLAVTLAAGLVRVAARRRSQ